MVAKIENIAEALVTEWQEEIARFDNAKYRRESETKLRATRTRYSELIAAMHRAAESMDPVLTKLQDQVLYLKHNLNARALGSLDQEVARLESDVARLLGDMQNSIAEADRFIADMQE